MKNIKYEKSNLQRTLELLELPMLDYCGDDEFACIDVKSLITKLPYKSPIWFRRDCFSITLAKNSYGYYSTKSGSFDIKPGTFFFTVPDVYRNVEWYEINDIYLFTFNERFLMKYAGIELFETFPFLMLETVVPCKANPDLFDIMNKICQQIDTVNRGDSLLKKKLIANLLTKLLLKIKQNFWADYEINFKKNEKQDIVKSFKLNLEQHYEHLQIGKTNRQLRVRDYANMQQIHENYFSSVIKKKTGKLPSEWVSEKTVFVMKKLLENTPLSIKEISYRMGFSYISYFSMFFKKHTGLSPREFRILSRVL